MKITGFETIVIELPGRSSYTWRSLQVPIGRYVILKVTTDEGVTGLGEAPCILSWGGEHGKYFGEDPHIVCYLANECFAPMLAGEDPRAIKTLFTRMDQQVRGYPYTKAMIESALLDIVGKRAGSPSTSSSVAPHARRWSCATAWASHRRRTRTAVSKCRTGPASGSCSMKTRSRNTGSTEAAGALAPGLVRNTGPISQYLPSSWPCACG